MGKERKCILCQIIYNSKQEMDEHMRSMLHHRELENLKGRDCGHECWVCGVTVVGLTDYASHISSPVHKARVEEQERRSGGDGPEEEYFDKELVQLIEKRKEQIRKEEAAAKLAQEEEEKKQQQRNEERQWLKQHGGPWGWGRGHGQLEGRRSQVELGKSAAARAWPPGEVPGSWNRQGRSTAWHADAPQNPQKWGGKVWGGKKKGYQGFSPQQRGQYPRPGGGGLYSDSTCYWEPPAGPYRGEVETDFTMELDNGQFPLSARPRFQQGPSGLGGGAPGPQRRAPEQGGAQRRPRQGQRRQDRRQRWQHRQRPAVPLGPLPPGQTRRRARADGRDKDPAVDYATVPPVQVKDLKLNFDFVLGGRQPPAPPRKQQGEKGHAPQTNERASQKSLRRRGSSSTRRDERTAGAQRPATPSEQTKERAVSAPSPAAYRRAPCGTASSPIGASRSPTCCRGSRRRSRG
ncbi:hypothetical protein AAFF_G00387120 [Aldrovandia affinis]|uniref:C2H2-type domain-containing protein n=1 Tax=Aldrovandia affinis TaxID=143900 RepID=A0AAD7WLI2_9TELE|nr:hypothetical protein AAFF_G00387120 [Aldrovandia affinis]